MRKLIVKDLLRTIVWFGYFFGYLITHQGVLHRGQRAMAEGDEATLRAIVEEHVPHWCNTLLRLAGVTVTVEGKENIPAGRPSVFVGNHRSYYDIPLMLTCLDAPHALVSKAEVSRFPMVRGWMALLRCVYVERGDARASLQALNQAGQQVREGRSVIIFPEGTRHKGPEGTIGEFKGGAFRIALKTKAPVVPVAISHSRDVMENNGMRMHPAHVTVRILPAIEVAGMSREEQKALPEQVQELIRQNLTEARPDRADNPYHRLYTQDRSFEELAGPQAGQDPTP